ncbi:ARF-binding protein [Cryptotrichosporon argae]
MLATSSRPWSSLTPIQALVEQACDPTLPEPNHAVNIELAELIVRKKANSAREATRALLVHINSRNPNQSLLALATLDHLVKNCGYPVHLQISTKEFLNELVRRFPERPPMVTGRVMGRILELIHEWKNTLCVHSKYKDDLVHIRDMHRLLSYKGYRFKSFDAARALADANPNENLKSPEELEEEDRAAKSAKLQELIRRGTPRDLAAAQELMKQLSGAEPDKEVDYTSQTLAELDKVQSKALLLNDMLNNAREGERIGVDGDVYDQVAAACRGARPKIQKWVEDDTGEREGVMERLLLCNDLINNALDRYEACKKGDWAKAQALVEAANPNQKAADLISFDAFADDADEAPLSGHGGLALPSGTAAAPSATEPGLTASGLPLDLFSAASPAPACPAAPALASPAHRQDPMVFFNTQQPLVPQPSASPAFGGLGSLHSAPPPAAPSSYSAPPAAADYSVPPQPSPVLSINGTRQQPAQPQPQPPKKDAFADLVDLMN